MSFLSWLKLEFGLRNIDYDVYSPYILTLLENDMDIFEILGSAFLANDADIQTFADLITVEYKQRKALGHVNSIGIIGSNIVDDTPPPNPDDLLDISNEINQELNALTLANASNAVEEDYMYEEEEEYEDCPFDFISMAEYVHESLAMYNSSNNKYITYSNEAVLSACYMFPNDIAYIVNNILYTEYFISVQKTPCRHLLTSKCLLKNCMYEHDLGHIPCVYWLTIGRNSACVYCILCVGGCVYGWLSLCGG